MSQILVVPLSSNPKTNVLVACPYCSTNEKPTWKSTQILADDEPVRYPDVERQFAFDAKLSAPVSDLRQGIRKCPRCKERFYVVYSREANLIRVYKRGGLPSFLYTGEAP
jgi:hypothetical protein